jgi:hypothetical protein
MTTFTLFSFSRYRVGEQKLRHPQHMTGGRHFVRVLRAEYTMVGFSVVCFAGDQCEA